MTKYGTYIMYYIITGMQAVLNMNEFGQLQMCVFSESFAFFFIYLKMHYNAF